MTYLRHVFVKAFPENYYISCSLVTSRLNLPSFLFKIFKIYFRERRGRGKERSICFSTYLCSHWFILVCVLARDQTSKLGILG